MAAMRFVVHGRVQGVGFRWWVWRQAEVIVEGSDSGLVELERLLAQGPPAAQVERVEKSQVPHEGLIPNGFDIK